MPSSSNDFNLNISRYVGAAQAGEDIDLAAIHAERVVLGARIKTAAARHNAFLDELGLP